MEYLKGIVIMMKVEECSCNNFYEKKPLQIDFFLGMRYDHDTETHRKSSSCGCLHGYSDSIIYFLFYIIITIYLMSDSGCLASGNKMVLTWFGIIRV